MSTALVFAGQGAQFVGMGADLAEAIPSCKALFDQANDVLGYDIAGMCFEGPVEELTKSNNCQPAIFVTSIACCTALKEAVPGIDIAAAAGLSLGEWSALHMAGALTFEDTLRVLEARGRFMQEACDERDGGMVSVIGLSQEQLNEICAATGVYIANMNSTAQTVLSGERHAIAEAEKMATAVGAKRAIVLQVAGAFHSPLMESAAPRLEAVLADIDIKDPAIPVYANVTGAVHASADDIRRDMIKQVTGTVHWYEGIDAMAAAGVDRFIECGPGRVLSGLIKRIASGAMLSNVQDSGSLEKTSAALTA